MTMYASEDGVHRFALNEHESLSLSLTPDHVNARFNHSEPYELPIEGLREIRVENQMDLHFHESPHREYLAGLMHDLGLEQGVCVDIGAYDGLNYSHTFPFFQQGWTGLAGECDPSRFSRLAHIYRMFEDVSLSRQKITPGKVCALLNSAGIPQNFELLSIDIDSYDYYVLEALLSKYRPTVICAEINEVIPPPVRFSVNYDIDFSFSLNDRFYGQSLAMLDVLCQRHNYVMVRMYYMDVFLVDRRYIEGESQTLTELYKEGFLDLPRPHYYSQYPFDVEAVLAAKPEAAADLIRSGFSHFSGQFLCEV